MRLEQVAEQVVEGAQYGSYKAATVTSILFDGNQILGSSGTVKQCFYGSYKNMLNSNFKIGTCKTIITTGGITIKIFLPMQMKRSVHRRGEIGNGEQEHYYFHNNNNWAHFNI